MGRDPLQSDSEQLKGNSFWPKWTDPAQQCNVENISKPILEVFICPSLITMQRYITKFPTSILCHREIAEHFLFLDPLGLITILEVLTQMDERCCYPRALEIEITLTSSLGELTGLL